ncbi:MAG: PhoX family phosphatase [Burkholderiales bacterium]
MNKPLAPALLSATDPDDIGHNDSPNPTFDSVLQARLGRRSMLRGAVGSAATAVFGSLSMTACGGGDDNAAAAATGAAPLTTLGFTAVAKSLADALAVPTGYTATVLYRCGDPLTSLVGSFANDGSDGDFDLRAGDCHDGIEYFGLKADGTGPDASNSDRGLLGMNHEYQNNLFLFPNGPTANPRPAAEVDKEVAVHGLSIVEVRKSSGGVVSYVHDSAFNRRITAATPMTLAGPVAGDAQMVTTYSPTGVATRGTQNNCGTGTTPWGTLLTCEENWIGYFTRSSTDDTARGGATAKSVVSLKRYGLNAGAASRYGWETGGVSDLYARWNASQIGASSNGSDDYRNITNTFGWVVEIDPYDRNVAVKKRTALGRFAHEAAAYLTPQVGKPLAFYMGDDSRGEYIYKFVSDKAWAAADATPTNRITTGDSYLDSGKLYVARFNADGSGDWLLLDISVAAIATYASYSFANQADVLVNARLAADAVGATKMDRPEWSTVNPATDDIYFTLTNNSNRVITAASGKQVTDAANPRTYNDVDGKLQKGNVNGHIIRMAETGRNPAATAFRWDIYLFGAESDAAAAINLSGLTADQDFSSPDGMRFAKSTGLAWIETDDGAYTDVTNCMLLASVAGSVGDGAAATVSNTLDAATNTQATFIGKAPSANTLKRFLVGPSGAEITGICETPDGKALFINIQHPGEETLTSAITTPASYQSHWPDGGTARPRSATIVITKSDGGRIGT